MRLAHVRRTYQSKATHMLTRGRINLHVEELIYTTDHFAAPSNSYHPCARALAPYSEMPTCVTWRYDRVRYDMRLEVRA